MDVFAWSSLIYILPWNQPTPYHALIQFVEAHSWMTLFFYFDKQVKYRGWQKGDETGLDLL